jgi:hypothetical protein
VGDKSARDGPVVIYIQYTYPAQIPQGVLSPPNIAILPPSITHPHSLSAHWREISFLR